MSKAFNKSGTLALVCVATAMLMLDIAVVNTALPQIARDLHSGLSGVEWVVDAYTLTLAAVVLSAGSLSDRFGRRLIFAFGMAVFTAASLACALAGSIAVLDGARAVQGIGAAMLFATAQTADVTVKMPMPQAKTRLRPMRSATEPAVRTIVASASV